MMIDVRWFRGAHWGSHAVRRYFGESHWSQPLEWDRQAQKDGQRHRVFCASMADVFDNEVAQFHRERLWEVIRRTRNLDWLILTKRIGNASRMLPRDWGGGYPNVWLIVSMDQSALQRDLPKLLALPALIHGASIEPQLGPVWLGKFARKLQWVIVGGESGTGARPFQIEWLRSLIKECTDAGTPIFVQKLGCKPFENSSRLQLNEFAGSDWNEWPMDVRVRQLPCKDLVR